MIRAIIKPALKASSIKPQPDNEVAKKKHITGKINFFIAIDINDYSLTYEF